MKNIMDQKLKKSIFSHIFEKDGKYILQHSILMRPLVLDEEAFSIFNMFQKPIMLSDTLIKNDKLTSFIEHLFEEKMIVRENTNEIEVYRRWVKNAFSNNNKSILYIIPTDKCNIGCGYCFMENSMKLNHKFSLMSSETMKKGVDFFAQHYNPKSNIDPVVIFYGGEPLLNPRLIVDAIDYISEKYPNFKQSIVTNGILISEEIAEIFTIKDISVGISIDGMKDNHDKARVYNNGTGTFEHACNGLRLLQKYGCKNLGVSYTVGSHNVNTVVEDIKYLHEELNVKSFGINFLIDTVYEKNPLAVSIEKSTLKVIEAFKYLRKHGIYEDRIMRKVKPFIKGTIYLKDCGAPGNQIVLAPNGDIGPCQAFLPLKKFFTQNINKTPNITNDPSFNEWKERYPINMDSCLSCEAIGICGGGCPFQSYLDTGSIWGLDDRMCKHNKILIDWLVWDTYESQN